MTYRHTQIGLLGPLVFVPMALVFVVIVVRADAGLASLAGIGLFFVVVAAVLLNFSRLTITVDDREVCLEFGRGWPRRRIDLAEVTNVGVVRNLWWYGFGIRLTPNGWLYNVWGLDAVELRLVSGQAVRIGSDESEALATAIKASLPSDSR